MYINLKNHAHANVKHMFTVNLYVGVVENSCYFLVG